MLERAPGNNDMYSSMPREHRHHIDAACTLGEPLRERLAFVEITVDDHLLLARQCLANAFGVYVRVAIHIPADPGAEADQRWQLDGVGRHAIELFERLRELVVKSGHDAIENLDQIEDRVLTLVSHGQAL